MAGVTRAPRFDLKLPVQYRIGDGEWHYSKTENVSRTGALFVTDAVLESGTKVEMVLVLQADHNQKTSPQVLCSGEVVRRLPDEPTDQPQAVAVTFSNYRFSYAPPVGKA
jgi:hypothetical protein